MSAGSGQCRLPRDRMRSSGLGRIQVETSVRPLLQRPIELLPRPKADHFWDLGGDLGEVVRGRHHARGETSTGGTSKRVVTVRALDGCTRW
jgi:hypothetical protein